MRILNRLLITIPTVLLLVSFIFSILSITSSSWATAVNYYVDNIGTQYHIGARYRGPFNKCLPVLLNNNLDPRNISNYYSDCSIKTCNIDSFWQDLPYLCQQLQYVQNFLISGTVFTGMALVMSILFIFPWTRSRLRWAKEGTTAPTESECREDEGEGRRERRTLGDREHDHGREYHFSRALRDVLTFSTHLSIILGLGLLAIANLTGSNLFVNNVPNDGDAISSQGTSLSLEHWLVGKGSWFAFVSWLPSLLAAVVFPNVAQVNRRRGN